LLTSRSTWISESVSVQCDQQRVRSITGYISYGIDTESTLRIYLTNPRMGISIVGISKGWLENA